MSERYYRLELDDAAAASFTSLGKYYYGTLDEIAGFISAFENDPKLKDDYQPLISAFKTYVAGDHQVKHMVAYREVPFLTPVRLLHEEKGHLENFSWEHLNTWRWPYMMRCEKAECRHFWFKEEETFVRCVKAVFYGLAYEGLMDDWIKVGDMLWGYSHMIEFEPPRVYNRLAEIEKTFKTRDDALADIASFRSDYSPDFTEFCNDIFGDG